MLGSHQQSLPCEGTVTVCWTSLERTKCLQMEAFTRVAARLLQLIESRSEALLPSYLIVNVLSHLTGDVLVALCVLGSCGGCASLKILTKVAPVLKTTVVGICLLPTLQ